MRPSAILIDAIGLGAGVYDRCKESGLSVRAINVGEAAATRENCMRHDPVLAPLGCPPKSDRDGQHQIVVPAGANSRFRPGAIETPMVAVMLAKEPDIMKDILKEQPIGRFGRPEEIAAAVLWLCSPAQAS